MDPHGAPVLRIVRSPEQATELIKIFRDMADKIELRGWAQHAPIDLRGRICLVQALGEATEKIAKQQRYSFSYWRRVDNLMGYWFQLANAALLAWVGGLYVLTAWNDEPGRTAEEVTKELRSLADFLAEYFHV